ncbi:MAG: 3-isopropylmalate dehydratase large subunit, partial [Gammaproteobacteria bacterium]|nr:3-isopropylmalate dehydratase large subunit [Gammaproteobacteria bacterium]
MANRPRTLFEKVWEDHLVTPETDETPAVLYIDLHLIHEVTSPQAFSSLRERGLRVRRPERTLATMDHSTPTRSDLLAGGMPKGPAGIQVATLEKNCQEFGIELHNLAS